VTLSLPHFVARSVRLGRQQTLASGINDEGFLQAARAHAAGPPSAVLLSGGHTDCSRYSLAAWNPWLVLRSKGDHVSLWSPDGEATLSAHPLDCLDAIFAQVSPGYPLVAEPFAGGAVGYLAYELKNLIEDLPRKAFDDLGLPEVMLFFPRELLIHDRHRRELQALSLDAVAHRTPPGERAAPSAGSRLCATTDAASRGQLRLGPLQSNFTRAAYLQAVNRVRDYIRAGDVYQVNLSQRFRFPLNGDPWELWAHLFALNPAPFYAYLDAGDHQLLSTSMERFLYRRGDYIETRPIKGTRKRGLTAAEDEALRRELLESPKDDAELSMIVDLLRNDLGRVCRPRTIRVAEHKRLESYRNVHHLVSIVTGELNPETSYGDLVRATFPGGSITGCPKIRSMEIIDELEPHVRHVYTGAIGYLGWHRNLDLNIAIRTATVHRGTCYFSVGGGIVYDSEAADEYEETLHKAHTLFEVMGKVRGTPGV
jgi:para-aminobenzoate synthetase component 1